MDAHAGKPTLTDLAVDVLTTADADKKATKSRAHAETWLASRSSGTPLDIGITPPPDDPARPAHPELLAPRDVPKRRVGTDDGRTAMLHAVAHIELNAIDLHWDMIARFADADLPLGFFDDWARAADDEARHFDLLNRCLIKRGSRYGAFAAHAGMWRAAADTRADLMGRLAVVPMVLEARGLDVTPGMIDVFQRADDRQEVAALETIYAEEVAHVAYGSKWFHFLCGRQNEDPKPLFHKLVHRYFHGPLRPPFNEEKRAEAGLPPDFYWPLTAAEMSPD